MGKAVESHSGEAVNTGDAREWLELQVAALADGSIDAGDRGMVEAAVASDPSLGALLSDQRRVDALLRRTPDFGRIHFAGLADAVMNTVRADLAAVALGAAAPAAMQLSPMTPAPMRPAVAAASGWTIARTIRWAGVAAALTVGLGFGATLLKTKTPATIVPAADPTMLVERGSQTIGVDPTKSSVEGRLAVNGPTVAGETAGGVNQAVDAVLNPGHEATAAATGVDGRMNVVGPDITRAVTEPKVTSNFPDYAGVTETSRKAVVTGTAAVADANPAPAGE